jgi:hypothetical protein
MSDEHDLRQSPAHAREVFERLLPRTDDRTVAVRILVDAIVLAHRGAPSGWGVTLKSNLIRLNVGSVESILLKTGMHKFIVDGESLSYELREQLSSSDSLGKAGLYARYPQGVSVHISGGDLASVYERVKVAYTNAIRGCVQAGYRWKSSHSPGVLRYLANQTGTQLPDPDYMAPQERPSDDGPRGLE